MLQIEKILGKRERLAPRLPIMKPIAINASVANVCNLKCEFCSNADKNFKHNKSFIDLKTMKSFVDNLAYHSVKLKVLTLAGTGEPLLHKDIVKMVSYISEGKITESIDIITNATLLNEQLSRELSEAGLGTLRISINGLSDEEYEKYTGRKIDYESLRNSIEYFYKHKGNTRVYIKIMSYMVNTEERRLKYESDFKNICDVLNIENVFQLSNDINYSEMVVHNGTNMKGGEQVQAEICPLPFYQCYLNADGTISACCEAGAWHTPPMLIMGNIEKESINDIWNGEKMNKLRVSLLRNENIGICRNCSFFRNNIYKEDVLDYDCENLLEIYLGMLNNNI